ncbi:MAG: hypothetical protein NW207_10175 [Cytophagales bacterium]|nr:hypothetical protein [Cytophagales bacterium]
MQYSRGQSLQEGFGKNRVQYQNFEWSVISTDNFEIYYYRASKNAAVMAAHYAETEFEKISDLLGYVPTDRIKLIVYATHSDYLQSNVGLTTEKVFVGGYSIFLKNKIEVYFNGVQTDLQKEIAKSISNLFLNEMMYGGGLKQVLQSTYLFNLPEWYLSGLVYYLSEGWSTEMDDKIRDLFLNRNFKKPNRLKGEDAQTAGASMWNYLAERYGRHQIGNVCAYTKIRRSYEKGFAQSISTPYKIFLKEWKEYYTKQAGYANDTFDMPKSKHRIIRYTRDDTYYGSIKLSPDGTRFAYVKNKNGRYKVMVKNVLTNKKYVVYRGGYKMTDQKINYDIPVVAWRNNEKIGIIAVKADRMKLVTYDIKQQIENTAERMRLEVSNFFNIRYSQKQTYRGIYKHFKQVNDFNFSEDGATIVLSGENVSGQSDIYIYSLRNNLVTPITNDVYDDRNPVFIPKSQKEFVFNSNRQTDSLMPRKKLDFRKMKTNQDIFYYHLDSSKTFAKRITNSPSNEIAPRMNRAGEMFYLSDRNGIFELYKQKNSTSPPLALTNYRQNLISYDINNTNSDFAFIIQDNNKRRIYLDTNFNFNNTYDSIAKTDRKQLFDNTVIEISAPKVEPTVKIPVITRYEMQTRKKSALLTDTSEIDINNYIFEFEKEEMRQKMLLASQKHDTSKTKSKPPIKRKIVEIKLKYNELYISNPLRYKHDFGIDYINTSTRIDPLRGLGMVGAVNMSDIMANHRMNAGVFAVFDFKTSIMWGEYEYLKYRADFKLRYTKDALNWTLNQGGNNPLHKYTMHKLEATVSYPFNPMFRVSATPFVANTRFLNIIPQSDTAQNTSYLGGTVEWVYDNIKAKGVNHNHGFKGKMGISTWAAIGEQNVDFTKLYIDCRYYQPVHRELLLATRFSAGSYIGPGAKTFMIGGMDNWIINSTTYKDDSHPLITPENKDNRDLLFIEYVTNLRGFNYSAQYGKHYFLINAELRMHIFKYFINRNIKSNFIRNFQLASFYDFGTAWSGDSPFTTSNSINTTMIDQSPFKATVTNYQNPFLAGYGVGIRTMISGYYVKFDVGWGIRNFVIQPVRLYLTLGYDF